MEIWIQSRRDRVIMWRPIWKLVRRCSTTMQNRNCKTSRKDRRQREYLEARVRVRFNTRPVSRGWHPLLMWEFLRICQLLQIEHLWSRRAGIGHRRCCRHRRGSKWGWSGTNTSRAQAKRPWGASRFWLAKSRYRVSPSPGRCRRNWDTRRTVI